MLIKPNLKIIEQTEALAITIQNVKIPDITDLALHEVAWGSRQIDPTAFIPPITPYEARSFILLHTASEIVLRLGRKEQPHI